MPKLQTQTKKPKKQAAASWGEGGLEPPKPPHWIRAWLIKYMYTFLNPLQTYHQDASRSSYSKDEHSLTRSLHCLISGFW